MKKIKVSEIFSEEYPGGRIDIFTIPYPKISPHHSHIIPLFQDMGFPDKEDLWQKLDREYNTDLEDTKSVISRDKNLKAIILFKRKEFLIILDSNKKKEEIIKFFDKYFEFD
jgi:hypothetical protein